MDILTYGLLNKKVEEAKNVSGEKITEAVNTYLDENPPTTGATAEQAAQINKNVADIDGLKGNLDDETTRATNRENEIESLFTMPTQEAVNNWLNDHPEATTTVQDHSLTFDKMAIGTLGYFTPEMFGAVGDGVADDGQSIKQAILNAGENGIIYLGDDKIYNIGSNEFTLLNGQKVIGGGTLYQPIEHICKTIITTSGNNIINGITIKGCYSTDTDSSKNTAILLKGDNIIVKNCVIDGKGNGFWGDNTYGNNTIIENNKILFTIRGIYICRNIENIENRITGLIIKNNYIAYKSGYSGVDIDNTRGCIIAGCKGALVEGNTILGAPMSFGIQNLPTTDVAFVNNMCDVYVSMVGDTLLCSNNIIDIRLRPSEHCEYSWDDGSFPGIEIAGNNIVVSNNEIYGVKMALSTYSTIGHYRENSIIGNSIKNCERGLYLRGCSEISINGNIITDCKASITICNADEINNISYDVNICNNIIKDISTMNTSGAIVLFGVKDVIISNNTIQSVGYCLNFGLGGFFVINVDINNNSFKSLSGTVFNFTGYYENEIFFENNSIYYKAYDSISRKAHIGFRDYVYPIYVYPDKGTWKKGELLQIDSDTYQLMRITKRGTFGNVSNTLGNTCKISTVADSNIAIVDAFTATILTEGQIVNIQNGDQDIAIAKIEYEYNDRNIIIGGTVTLEKNATITVNNANVSYSNPTFKILYIKD